MVAQITTVCIATFIHSCNCDISIYIKYCTTIRPITGRCPFSAFSAQFAAVCYSGLFLSLWIGLIELYNQRYNIAIMATTVVLFITRMDAYLHWVRLCCTRPRSTTLLATNLREIAKRYVHEWLSSNSLRAGGSLLHVGLAACVLAYLWDEVAALLIGAVLSILYLIKLCAAPIGHAGTGAPSQPS